MKQQLTERSKYYDRPIPKPPDEMFESFLRHVEDRLVTKRLMHRPGTDRNSVKSEQKRQ